MILFLYFRYDFVFLNSILGNLNDEDALKVVEIALRHLNKGGHLFFREVCLQSMHFY